jgi:tetratricopeptide (TPR) repeat protein
VCVRRPEFAIVPVWLPDRRKNVIGTNSSSLAVTRCDRVLYRLVTAIFDPTANTFPEFEVIAELGRGAETVVYRVRRRGREYSLKLLTGAGGDGRALTALRREAALLGCVDHPMLPRIFEVGQVEAGPYLILEFIDGYSLSQILHSGRLDETLAVRMAINVVEPLAAAHRAGLVHRDVKPDNIIICPDGTARLIDFGLVFRRDAHHDRLAGTLLYGAPEQTALLRRAVDGRSDLYALGVVLFECVTGYPPYRSNDPRELIQLHATAPIPDPRSIRPDLSPTFAAMLVKLLAKDPEDRYQDGESLLADLHSLYARPGAVFEVGQQPGEAVPTAGDSGLLGRDNEVVHLANRWLTARGGRGGAILVEGGPGVGKSRLVQEVTTAVATDGDLVLYGKCLPDDPVPLAPLRAAVERHLRTVDRLPEADRGGAIERLRRAAGRGGALLGALSPHLAELIQAPVQSDNDRHEQFINAVVAFLVGLADESQGAILHLDDVHWLDGSTHRVLQQLTSRLPGTPLLVIGTARDDTDNRPAVDRFMSAMDATLDTRLALGPLGRAEVADLVAGQLGGMALTAVELDELVSRVGGNPFTVGEYLRAVIDAGLIMPTWDGWRLDLDGLDRLDLSGDALELVLQRIDGLGLDSRHLLAAGAAAGRRFDVDLVARICNLDPRVASQMMAEAEGRRLVTAAGPNGYRFPHDRVREALLAGLDPGTQRRLHQRMAEVLEELGGTAPRDVYARARHYALGETSRAPEKVYESGLAAGKLALAEHAPAEARDFLLTAAAAATHARLTPGPELDLAIGLCNARTGRFAEALDHLERALGAEQDPLLRAAVLIEIAHVHAGAWDPAKAFQAVRRGLSELDRPLPTNGLRLAAGTVASLSAGLLIGFTKLGFGSAAGRKHERYRLQARLYDAGALASSMQMHRKMRAILGLRSVYTINRLGHSAEYIRHMAGFGVMADVAKKPELATRLYDRAAAVAADLGDPTLIGHVEWKRGAGRHLGAADDGQTWMRALIEHERWLDLGDYLTGVSSICIQLVKRGRTHDAEAWFVRGRSRLGVGAQAEGAAFGTAAAAIAAQRGRMEEASAEVEALRWFLARNPGNVPQQINLFAARIIVLVELGELGEPFERVVSEFAAFDPDPETMVPEQKVYYVYEALGRLTQCHQARPDQLPGYRAAAERSVAALGEAADNKVLHATHQVARADLTLLAGDPEAALRDLAQAELALLPLDAPLITYEAARVRARALRALDEPGQARSHARFALMLAADQQWAQRIRWIEREFGINASTPVWTTGTSLSTTTGRSVPAAP